MELEACSSFLHSAWKHTKRMSALFISIGPRVFSLGLVVIQPLFSTSWRGWSEKSHSHASPKDRPAHGQRRAHWAPSVSIGPSSVGPQRHQLKLWDLGIQQYPAVSSSLQQLHLIHTWSIKSWWLVKLMDTTWWIWWIRRETSTGKHVSFACVYPKSWGQGCVQIFPETILNQSNEYKWRETDGS